MKLMTIVGARPQFIKAAAVSAAIRDLGGGDDGAGPVDETIVHTGQHYDAAMSDVFFEELGVPAPGVHLGVGSGSHGAQTGEMMRLLEDALAELGPDAVMVYGDTNSTLAGALVAAKADLPLVHVESGLRSGVRAMPEEVNRVVTDHVATMLLCPCDRAVEQLRSEGIEAGVENVGDVMLDVLRHNLERSRPAAETLDRLGVTPDGRGLAVVTVHRPANTDDPDRFAAIIEGVGELAESGWDVVWPVHPRVRERLSGGVDRAGVHLVEPLSYLELLGLLREAGLVATDSGGVQREAFWLGVPCLTLRPETEWPETVEAGFNALWAGDGSLVLAAESLVEVVAGLGEPPPVYGEGNAAGLIAARLAGLA